MIIDNGFITDLLRGEILHVSWSQLVFLLHYQNDFHINTISIQQDCDGQYYCKVDDLTAKKFNEGSQI